LRRQWQNDERIGNNANKGGSSHPEWEKELIRTNLISADSISGNIAYTLHNRAFFSPTGYKVLSGFDNESLIKCAKYAYNGNLKFLYFSSGYVSLATWASACDEHACISTLANLFNAILGIKSNGFLNCNNLDISADTIFVDTNTMSVHLIYLPVNMPEAGAEKPAFENELRSCLSKTIGEAPSLDLAFKKRIVSDLSDAAVNFPQLIGRFNAMRNETPRKVPHETPAPAQDRPNTAVARLMAVNAPEDIVFTISKAEFVIGKSAAADGAVTYSTTVSRAHCKIISEDSGFYVMDLNSKNGTFLNGKRLPADNRFPLAGGDILRLADSEFRVTINDMRG
jgi:hypothetical protein